MSKFENIDIRIRIEARIRFCKVERSRSCCNMPKSFITIASLSSDYHFGMVTTAILCNREQNRTYVTFTGVHGDNNWEILTLYFFLKSRRRCK
jgi:hypothetical protein